MTAQTQSFLQGEIVDERYRLGQYLGGSEHSAVFLTQFGEIHQRNAAIKLLAARRGSAELQLSRWRLAANLAHPHLVRILDMGRCIVGSSPMLYVVTELANENLAEILPERSLTTEEGREMLVPVVDALSLIHTRGCVHGRLRPSNIMVVGERIKLSSDSICRLSDPVETVGRPSVYDPPEGTRNGASPTADMWSLGVTIVEALSQEIPEWNPAERREPAIPESVPPPFAEFARHCLRRDPKNRWTATTIRTRLPRSRAQVPEREPEPTPEHAEERSSPHLAAPPPELAQEREPSFAVEPFEECADEQVPERAANQTSPPAPVSVKTQAVAHALRSAAGTCGQFGRNAWQRLEAIEWRRYARAAGQSIVAAWRRLPIDTLKRHARTQWRRYALAGGTVVLVLTVIVIGSKLGGRNSASSSPEAAANGDPVQPTAGPNREPNPAKPSAPAPSHSASSAPSARALQPPAPVTKKPQGEVKQQPLTPPSAATPSVPPSNVPSISSTSEPVQGRVLHQVIPEIPSKASNTIWGTVRVGVRVNVDSAGKVTSASLDSAGPSRYFARLSFDAARNWKFTAPQMNGAAVSSVWVLHFSYRRDGSTVQPSQLQP